MSEAESLLVGLDPAQRAAVAHEASPLCILAGAGSGKTRVLTRRIAWRIANGSADAEHVMAVTFTRKAAGELRSRLQALGVRERMATGTFHALAYAQLRRRWADLGETPPTLLERKARLLAPLIPRSTTGARASVIQPADLASEIEWAKARMVSPARYEEAAAKAARQPPIAPARMAAVYERYEAEKQRRGLVDFDDLLWRCVKAIEGDASFAAAQRWRFRHLFVDEFQDVNPVQFRLLKAWLGESVDLCVVGDPNQAIYSWNGADPSYLIRFADHFPDAGVVRLDRNYRSTPQVINVANAMLEGPGLVATCDAGPSPSVSCYANEVAEAQGVARRARAAHASGVPWSGIAVLTRTNAQGVLFEEAFRKAKIPVRVRGGGALLEQPEVKEAIADLRHRRANVLFHARLADLEAALADDTGEGNDERRANLEALVRLGHEHLAIDPSATTEGFLAWLYATIRGDEPDRGGDTVDVVTFHRAKGLEWKVVFVCGLERGLVPIARATAPGAEAEERRLVYVALTRAEVELHCSWAEHRTLGSRTVSRTPSPWLDEIEAAVREVGGHTPAVQARERIAQQRARLGATRGSRGSGGGGKATVDTSKADHQVLADLKQWRSTQAKAAKVPAYVVFDDATLTAVASLLPRSRPTLLDVPGIGPVKAERYGDDLLAIVARHAS